MAQPRELRFPIKETMTGTYVRALDLGTFNLPLAMAGRPATCLQDFMNLTRQGWRDNSLTTQWGYLALDSLQFRRETARDTKREGEPGGDNYGRMRFTKRRHSAASHEETGTKGANCKHCKQSCPPHFFVLLQPCPCPTFRYRMISPSWLLSTCQLMIAA